MGILLVNFIGKDSLSTYGVLAVWMYAPLMIDRQEHLFWHILLVRVKNVIWVVLLGKILSREKVMRIGRIGWSLFAGACFAMAIMARGIYGVLLAAGVLIPQWVFYLAALTLYGKGKNHMAYLLSAGCFLLGCFIEGSISPNILKKIF